MGEKQTEREDSFSIGCRNNNTFTYKYILLAFWAVWQGLCGVCHCAGDHVEPDKSVHHCRREIIQDNQRHTCWDLDPLWCKLWLKNKLFSVFFKSTTWTHNSKTVSFKSRREGREDGIASTVSDEVMFVRMGWGFANRTAFSALLVLSSGLSQGWGSCVLPINRI